ncbi:reverse transcriptase domain-containing protein [Tanacetum coccineum]
MPSWRHMFNSTLTGNARVWFEYLPPESIDSYDDLKKAFLENYLQQKKCIKDPIEIHNIKQREGVYTKDFVKRYKLESRNVKGASECMRTALADSIGDEEHSALAWMNFMVILVEGGVITLKSSKVGPLEYAMVSGPEETSSATKPIREERVKIAINLEYPEQTVMIGFTLTEEGRNKLCGLLQRNLDIFS